MTLISCVNTDMRIAKLAGTASHRSLTDSRWPIPQNELLYVHFILNSGWIWLFIFINLAPFCLTDREPHRTSLAHRKYWYSIRFSTSVLYEFSCGIKFGRIDVIVVTFVCDQTRRVYNSVPRPLWPHAPVKLVNKCSGPVKLQKSILTLNLLTTNVCNYM